MTDGPAAAVRYRHATVLVVGVSGVLIEGPSGSGKSSLAAALLRRAAATGLFARLVGDDRVGLTRAGDRLVARPHPVVAGLIERRGTGLERVAHEPACVLHMVARILPAAKSLPAAESLPARLPDERPLWWFAGLSLPMLLLPASLGIEDGAGQLAEAVAGLV